MKTNVTPAGKKPQTFWELNKRSGGILLRNKIVKWIISICRALLMFGLCFMIIQPLLIRFSTSFMEEKDLYDSTIVMLPRHVTLDNYRIVCDLINMPKSMLNTVWTSFLVAFCQIISTTLVAYGFARYQFPLKKFWFACCVGLIIIPPQTISTSLYIFFANFDFFGIIKATTGSAINLRGSITPYVLMSLTCMGLKNGLYIYMLRQYFRGVPKSLEEAAYIDGCGTMRTFVNIMLPDAMPIILSCFLFAFVWQWTDLFYSRNFLSTMSLISTELSNIVSKMSRYFSADSSVAIVVPVGRQQQLISIGVVICSLPLIILYCFTQKTFVKSLAMTGSKE